jgi:transcriptional regulator with XRE-family HTH domain
MDVAGVDVGRVRPKTRRVLTEEDKKRVGVALKKLRLNHGWDQYDIAEKADLGVGTVQRIEYGKPNVGRDNLDKYATVFDTTLEKLLHPELALVVPTNSLAADLHPEHLAIARGYMRGAKVVRAAVELLLAADALTDSFTEDVAEIVLAVARARDQTRDPQITYWVMVLLEHRDLMKGLARRLDDDPAFEEMLATLLYDDPPKGQK